MQKYYYTHNFATLFFICFDNIIRTLVLFAAAEGDGDFFLGGALVPSAVAAAEGGVIERDSNDGVLVAAVLGTVDIGYGDINSIVSSRNSILHEEMALGIGGVFVAPFTVSILPIAHLVDTDSGDGIPLLIDYGSNSSSTPCRNKLQAT